MRMLGQNRMKGAVAMELNPGVQRLRTQNRERLADLWRERTRPSEERDAEERQILRMMEAHQELHLLWDRLDHLDSEEINLGGSDGETVFCHPMTADYLKSMAAAWQ